MTAARWSSTPRFRWARSPLSQVSEVAQNEVTISRDRSERHYRSYRAGTCSVSSQRSAVTSYRRT